LRFRLAFVLLVGLVAIVAGCGGSNSSSATTETTTEATTTEDTTTTQDTTDEITTETTTEDDSGGSGGGSGSGSSFASSANCLKLLNLSSEFAKAAGAAGGADDLDATAKFFEQIADNAPEEIRGDFQVFAEAFAGYVKALGDADLKPGAQPTPAQIQALTKAAESFSEADVTKASNNIQAWTEKDCPS
jgi:hypothetical protein